MDVESVKAAGAWVAWWVAGMLAGAPIWLAARHFPMHPALAAAAVAAGLAVMGLVVHLPAWGACALVTLIYWNASDVVTDTWGFTWVLRLTLAGVMAAWLLNRLLRGEQRRLRLPLLGPLLVWGAAQALATLGAGDLTAASARLAEFAKGFGVFYLVANLLETPRAWRAGIDALLVGVDVLALPVVYQGLTGSHNTFWGFGSMVWAEIVPGQFGWRLGGALGDPNFLAMVLVASLPLAAVMALEPHVGGPRRILALNTLGLALAATLYTYSRAAFLGIGLLVVMLLLHHRRRQWVVAALAATVVAVTAIAPTALWGRLHTLMQSSLTAPRQQMTDASLSDRRHEMLTGTLMFLDHPLLGVGPGNYETDYLKYSALAGGGSDTRVRDPHSLYIQIAAETGVVGFAAFAWLLYAGFRLMERGRRRAARLGAPSLAGLLWALEMAVAIYLLISTFLHDAYFRHFMLLLALGGLGAALALETGAGHEPRGVRGNPSKTRALATGGQQA